MRRIIALLTAEERRRAGKLLALMLVGVALEALGVGLVVPAVALLTRSNAADAAVVAGAAINGESIVIAGLVLLAAVYAVKGVFLAFVAWRQTRLAFDIHANLSQRLFAAYLGQPYTFHLQRNSALLVRNVIGSVSLFTFEGILPALAVVTESLVIVGLSALLLILEPYAALMTGFAFGIAAWMLQRFTGARGKRWGAAYEHHEGLRMQHLQQGLAGAKDLKLLGREAEFLALYGRHNLQSARAGQMQTLVQQLPRLWLEVFAVGAMVLVAIALVWQGRAPETIVPVLAMFAAAAFRLIPSVNRIMVSVQSLRYCLPVIETLERELSLETVAAPRASRASHPFSTAIELRRVSFSYPGASSPALHEVSIEVRRGECIGIVGSSGAGKSTLVDVALGLLEPTSGKVLVDGRNAFDDLRGWQDQIGYVPQSIYLTDDTLRRNVAFGVPDGQIDDVAVAAALRAAQLEEFASSLPGYVETLIGERGARLSGGQRQRIGIARALYHDPSVLVLDEATSALDVETERDVIEAVRALQGRKTIIIVGHRFSTIERCQRVYRLDEGRIVESASHPAEADPP